MIILGIDPGTGRTGWGVVEKTASKTNKRRNIVYIAHGCIITTPDNTMPDRLLLIHKFLDQLIREHKPDCVVVESIFFGRNAKTAITVSQARGVILLTGSKNRVPIFEYTSLSVKYNLFGSGKMDKKEVQKGVRRILNKNSSKLAFSAKDKAFDDAADALAIAIHHALK